MTEAIDESWNRTDATDDVLNKTTYGQGTVFPSTWPTNRIFFRTDRKRLYSNIGILIAPVWEGVDIPISKIDMYAGPIASIPTGWLLCDGAAVSRTTYLELFTVIGETYGNGDGSTTFNLPDMVTDNRFPRAATSDVELGDTGGESEHTLTIAELAAHTHIQNSHNHTYTTRTASGGSTSGNGFSTGTSTTGATTATNQNTGNNSAHENKPPFIDIHFIIAI